MATVTVSATLCYSDDDGRQAGGPRTATRFSVRHGPGRVYHPAHHLRVSGQEKIHELQDGPRARLGAEVKDEPGGVAAKLSRLDEAGADLEYVYTQRTAGEAGLRGPVRRPDLGHRPDEGGQGGRLHEVSDPIVMRLEGDNTAGLAHRLKHAWAAAGINLHGSILTVIGTKFVGFVTFDSVADANKAARILAEVGHEKPVPAPDAGSPLQSTSAKANPAQRARVRPSVPDAARVRRMPIITCPKCQGKLRFPDDSPARRVKCPTCGNVIQSTEGATRQPWRRVRQSARCVETA